MKMARDMVPKPFSWESWARGSYRDTQSFPRGQKEQRGLRQLGRNPSPLTLTASLSFQRSRKMEVKEMENANYTPI